MPILCLPTRAAELFCRLEPFRDTPDPISEALTASRAQPHPYQSFHSLTLQAPHSGLRLLLHPGNVSPPKVSPPLEAFFNSLCSSGGKWPLTHQVSAKNSFFRRISVIPRPTETQVHAGCAPEVLLHGPLLGYN